MPSRVNQHAPAVAAPISTAACAALSMTGLGFMLPAAESQAPASQIKHFRGHAATAKPKVVASSSLDQVTMLGLSMAATAGAAALIARRPSDKKAVVLQAFENELGVQEPVGFWDPVGFTADGDVTAFKRRRATELKHGRISMLATMGYITPEITGKFPGYLSPSMGLKYSDIPNGLGAISKVPAFGWFQIVFYCLFVEYQSGFGKDWKEGTPGDLGWKMLSAADPAEKTRKLQAELANSRLAMTAIMAMFFQNGTIGDTGPIMWLGQPRDPGGAWAFENELGVQEPVGLLGSCWLHCGW
eukprot:TRINITY_DN2109_c0_g1_i2.p2 TRINITY_DN2109_c0_g1~~TRINITY_DN2109_c0_g1_i2.p2  ORF type:complete len:300 (-),score=79.02 TRINITY_DN2109_c0_g1_i2:642-1541(-)